MGGGADAAYAAAFFLTFGGVPAALVALLVSQRRHMSAARWTALALAYAAVYRRDARKPFGRDSAWFRSVLNSLVMPLFEEQGGKVILDAPIPPQGCYCVLGAPHGVVPLYFLGVTDWFKYGPEAKSPVALGANVMFNIPGLREICLNFAIPSTAANFARLAEARRSISLVPGGVAEMTLIRPGKQISLVTKHTGFVKLCLQHGVSMLPVFAFGENNCWVQKRPPAAVANAVARLTGGWYPFWYEGEYACIPKRGPVVIVSAAPIDVPKTAKPSDELVAEYHEKFYASLSALVRKYKAELPEFADVQVEFIGKPHLNVDWRNGKAVPVASGPSASASASRAKL